jgi:hypothetical protein
VVDPDRDRIEIAWPDRSELDWARVAGFRIEPKNPARWKGHLEHLLPKKSKIAPVAHHAALPYHDVGEFVAELRRQDGIAPRALEFLILTASRTGEVIGAPGGLRSTRRCVFGRSRQSG